MKKAFGIILFAAVVLVCAVFLPKRAAAEETTLKEGYYTYTVKDQQATITDCDTAISGEVIIPSTLGGYPVTAIGQYAFDYCNSLTGVTIPDSVTTIGEGAFSSCSSLKKMVLPFVGASRESVAVPESRLGYIFAEDVLDGDFMDFTVVTVYDVPSSLKEVVVTDAKVIGEKAFEECSYLTDITIPDGVTSIGDRAFYGCGKLTSVNIPSCVTNIGDKAFYECKSLTSITIPGGVTSIGEYAFYYCKKLSNVTLENGVTYIGEAMFYGCDSLETLTIPDSVTSIGKRAFAYSPRLTSLVIPKSVTSIAEGAFDDCSGLTKIEVSPNNPSYCTDSQGILYNKDKTQLVRALSSCTSCVIPNTVKSIAAGAFYGCKKLTKMEIPYGVVTIGDDAFRGCEVMSSITIPDSVTSIGDYAFFNCDKLRSVVVPNSVTSIGEYGFAYCDGLSSIVLSDQLTTISGSMFRDCDLLENISIPSGVTSILVSAFEDCTYLNKITLPTSLTEIKGWAFADCNCLRHIYYAGTEEQWNQIVIGSENDNVTTYANRYYNTAHTYKTEWSKDTTSHWHECTDCGDKKDLASHTWDAGQVTKPASCKEAGVKTYTCTVCKTTKTQNIAKLTTHAYVYITGGTHKCTVCGATNTHYHVWGNSNWTTDENGHWHTCCTVPACGEKVQYAAHTPGAPATETEPQKCTICDYIITPALKHTHSYAQKWTSDKGNHWHECSGCEEKADYAAHTWNNGEVTKAATEAETGIKTYTCTVCKATREEVLNKLPPAQPTEPSTTPTTVPTEPTTVPTEPATVPTEPTTVPTEPATIPTEPTPTDPADGGGQGGGGNGWIVVLILLAAIIGGLGGGIAVFLITKKRS